MKPIVTDIQDIRQELDGEDAELMRMFPRSRETALNEMLLVQKDGQMWLLKKEDVARQHKILHGMIRCLIGCFWVLLLLLAVILVVFDNGYPLAYLLIGELLLFAFLAKVPNSVKGGVRP